jgi:protein-S-isoprenylcysteine O-methyltransferase Ste14
MKRILVFAFGVASYLAFFATFVYSVGFIAGQFVPKSIDSAATSAPWAALLVNLVLLGAFGLQHSVMARPAFKRWFTRFVPESAERSVYVLASVAVMVLLFWGWQPIAGQVWHVENELGRGVLWALYLAGFGLVFYSTVLISHFDLFGLRQVWLQLVGRDYDPMPFAVPSLYKHIRHPLYVGWTVVFWATPTMSVGHLLFAVVCTAYMLVAIRFEERDLITHFGEQYRTYRDQVPGLIPRRRRPIAGAVRARA